MRRFCLALLLLSSLMSPGQPLPFKKAESGSAASFRGLSVADNQTAWAGGTKGTVGRTTDGGKTWNFRSIPGYSDLDFRSVYAFSSQRAIIANAGSPAYILLTTDGGETWKAVYTNNHKDAFFDGIDFRDADNGLIFGDPIDGKMLLLRTTDGGITWTPVAEPPLLETGEASFAASGTGIRWTGTHSVMICTGGIISRIWTSENQGERWSVFTTPIIQGQTTTGIFSFVQNKGVLHIVGGDYKNMTMNVNHNFYSINNGKDWIQPVTPTRGYRECIEAITDNILLSTGPTGTDISFDNGKNWKAFSDETGMHVVRKARKGSLVILAGSEGKIFIIENSDLLKKSSY